MNKITLGNLYRTVERPLTADIINTKKTTEDRKHKRNDTVENTIDIAQVEHTPEIYHN